MPALALATPRVFVMIDEQCDASGLRIIIQQSLVNMFTTLYLMRSYYDETLIRSRSI